jgi:hypothetical protein
MITIDGENIITNVRGDSEGYCFSNWIRPVAPALQEAQEPGVSLLTFGINPLLL